MNIVNLNKIANELISECKSDEHILFIELYKEESKILVHYYGIKKLAAKLGKDAIFDCTIENALSFPEAGYKANRYYFDIDNIRFFGIEYEK